MQFSPAAFNNFLNGIGQQFLWRRAYACPCINPDSGAAKPGCPLCNGKGRQWDSPVQGVAGVGGQRAQRQFAQLGLWMPGDVTLTIGSDSPLYAMGQFDRAVMLNATIPFSINLTRGLNDVLSYTSVAAIDRVYWLNSAGTANIAGGIPTVNADGSLTWTSGAPASGQVYSITGKIQAEYYCFTDLPSNRNESSGLPLPKKVLLRLFDLYGR